MDTSDTTAVVPSADVQEDEDPYYAKLGEFYSEWITMKEENEKTKAEESEKTFR
jgi:hypothetical protein